VLVINNILNKKGEDCHKNKVCVNSDKNLGCRDTAAFAGKLRRKEFYKLK